MLRIQNQYTSSGTLFYFLIIAKPIFQSSHKKAVMQSHRHRKFHKYLCVQFTACTSTYTAKFHVYGISLSIHINIDVTKQVQNCCNKNKDTS